MPSGLPLTIWLHTLYELFKRFAVAGIVLVTVLSFAVTVQPLSEGRLGTLEALRFMLLATIPMSAYALPFAGGFAATLVYHRMAQDNELLAAHAGGIGHVRLLVPAAVFGLALSALLGGINDQAIPRLLRPMEQMLSHDIARVMGTRIASGETVRINGVMIHAKDARSVEPDPASGARGLMLLTEPAFLETDETGRVVWDATASRAWVWFFGGGQDATRVVVRPEHVAVITEGTRAELSDIEKSFIVEGGVGDDPKFLTISQMHAARTNPDTTDMLERGRTRLAHWMAHEAFLDRTRQRLAEGQPAELVGRGGAGVRIHADSVFVVGESYRFGPRGEDGVIVERGADRMIVQTADLSYDASRAEAGRPPDYTLRLDGVRTLADDGTVLPGALGTRTISGLGVPADILNPISGASSLDLLLEAETATLGREQAGLNKLSYAWSAEHLRWLFGKMLDEITSKVHERFALTSLGLVMSIAGAVTAILLRNGLPLQVYLASFFPSLGSVLMISLGQQQTHASGEVGLLVLWSGIAAQIVGSLVVLMIVRRH